MFYTLQDAKIPEKQNLVMITGKGYPDVLSRKVVAKLAKLYPNLPLIYLGDCDPHGVQIYLCYSREAPLLHWMGVLPSDINHKMQFGIPGLDLTAPDRRMLTNLLRGGGGILAFQQTDPILKEIARMKESGKKYEIEALMAWDVQDYSCWWRDPQYAGNVVPDAQVAALVNGDGLNKRNWFLESWLGREQAGLPASGRFQTGFAPVSYQMYTSTLQCV